MFDHLSAREGEVADRGTSRACPAALLDRRGGFAFRLEHAAVLVQPAQHDRFVVGVRARLGVGLRADLRHVLHPQQLASLGRLHGLVVIRLEKRAWREMMFVAFLLELKRVEVVELRVGERDAEVQVSDLWAFGRVCFIEGGQFFALRFARFRREEARRGKGVSYLESCGWRAAGKVRGRMRLGR